jgi:uncharacterized membrane protein/mono/diheme cytochrome c family protein
MKNWQLIAGLLIALAGGPRPAAGQTQAAPPNEDIGRAVHQIFAAKCAGCHGADLEKPKGRIGYILNLRRVAANAEIVVPSSPDESELWILVRRDEMPPSDSPHGALAPEQKETIRKWIAAGAPDANSIEAHFAAPGDKNQEPAVSDTSSIGRFLGRVGKFHLLLVHFPIALILAAAVREVWSLCRQSRIPSVAVQFCLRVGALTAIPTAALGWFLAAAESAGLSAQTLNAHRWIGTVATIWVVITALGNEHDVRQGVRTRFIRFLILSGALITALAAHLGGLLVHGADFFSS